MIQITPPFQIFITGGAGVGKSFLIGCMIDWIRSCTAPFPGVDPILICAPTGVSAFNINGRTLHSVFHLPVAHSGQQVHFSRNSFQNSAENEKII